MHGVFEADLGILLLRSGQVLTGQQHGAIDGDRQPAMPAADHDGAEDEFAQDMPAAAEAVVGAGQADADADAAVGGDDFEDDVEDGIGDGVALELARFDDVDEEHGKDDPPQVVGQLPAELLADEVGSRDLFGGIGGG